MALAQSGSVLLRIRATNRKDDPRASALFGMDGSPLDPAAAYFRSLALYNVSGGPLWKAHINGVVDGLLSTQRRGKGRCDRGCWEGRGWRGRIEATACHGLTLGLNVQRVWHVFGTN